MAGRIRDVEIALAVMAILLAAVLILMGLASVQSLPTSVMFRDRIGVRAWLWRLLGVLDLIAAALLIVGALASPELVLLGGVLAAVSLVVVLGFQWDSRDPLPAQVPVVVLLAAAVLVIGLAVATR